MCFLFVVSLACMCYVLVGCVFTLFCFKHVCLFVCLMYFFACVRLLLLFVNCFLFFLFVWCVFVVVCVLLFVCCCPFVCNCFLCVWFSLLLLCYDVCFV